MVKKDLMIVLLIAAAAVMLIINLDIAPADGGSVSSQSVDTAGDGSYVTVSVRCENSGSGGYPQGFSESGYMLEETEFVLNENDSVFDVMSGVLGSEGISFDYSGVTSKYIKGIGGVYEFDFGKGSGWVYSVNGGSPEVSCSEYYPKSGDSIVFSYLCDHGGEKD